jgi:hypothetical protein
MSYLSVLISGDDSDDAWDEGNDIDPITPRENSWMYIVTNLIMSN